LICLVVLAAGYYLWTEVFELTGQVDDTGDRLEVAAENTAMECADECCRESERTMEVHNYASYSENSGCPEGYSINRLPCPSSRTWCEPAGAENQTSECSAAGTYIEIAGDSGTSSLCCAGLAAILDENTGRYFCAACGNQNCESPENYDNCPADCAESGQSSTTPFFRASSGLMEFFYPQEWSAAEEGGNIVIKKPGNEQNSEQSIEILKYSGELPPLPGMILVSENEIDIDGETKQWSLYGGDLAENQDSHLLQLFLPNRGYLMQSQTTAADLELVQQAFTLVASSWRFIDGLDDNNNDSGSAEPEAEGNPAADIDSDGDGLKDSEEILYGSDPQISDTDGDGYTDGDEVKNGYNPNGSGLLMVN
jgi:hypothetical protein